jgi:hypothetical protein
MLKLTFFRLTPWDTPKLQSEAAENEMKFRVDPGMIKSQK